MLRPMANIFAVADRDAAFLDSMEELLQADSEFAEVWRPAPGWVAATAPLPESEPDGEEIRGRGFAFAEGRDRLDGGRGLEWLDRVSELADRTPRGLAELPGDFGFVRFRADGSALAVRSCGGLAPLYVYPRTSGIAVGTLLNYFTRFLPDHFALDPLVNAVWGTNPILIEDRTFLEGVSIVPRGSQARLAPGRAPSVDTYWDPRQREGDDPTPSPEHAARLRDLLIETLTRDLDGNGRNLLTLSGGVDSTSLGAFTVGVVGRRLSSFSLIPGYEPERSHELSFIDPLVERYGIEPARRLEISEEVRQRWRTTSPGLPFQIMHPALCELPGICREQEVRVLVGGEFADEICGELGRIYDWARSTPPWSLLRGARSLPFGRRDYLRWAKGRLLDAIGRPPIPFPYQLPEWVHPDVREEYAEWLRGRRVERARDDGPHRELADRVASDGWVAMNWEGTTPLGVRRSIPFFTRECLELAFECHPRELLGPGKKRLLRSALDRDVPSRNLMRADKGGWGARDRDRKLRFEGELPEGVEGVVRPDWLPAPPEPLLNRDAVGLLRLPRVVEYLHATSARSSATAVDSLGGRG
jgi:asparagine synthetase B (glutamine-hydrolysing)